MSNVLGRMRQIPQWFLWRLTWDELKQKYEKKPCVLQDDRYKADGAIASMDHADPKEWNSYAAAVSALAALHTRFPAGGAQTYALGFYLTAECGLWFFDLDNAVVDGQVLPLAAELVQRFPGAMVEWSSGMRGMHVIGSGPVPEHRTKPQRAVKESIAPLELEFYNHGRGIAFGFQLDAAHGSADAVHDCRGLVAEYFQPDAKLGTGGSQRRAEWRGPEDDDALIERFMRSNQSAASLFGGKVSLQQLWKGECEQTNDNDMSLAAHLAFWTGCDGDRIERLMRRSGLVRDKWDSHRTYLRELTIEKACGSCESVYAERNKQPPAIAPAVMHARVSNAADLMARQFQPVQWAVRDILPEGVSILSGDPKAGKSWLALQMCTAVAAGAPLWPSRAPEEQGDALYLDLEGNERRLQRRLTKYSSDGLSQLHYATDWPRGQSGVDAIRKWLTEHPKARIVVIDTLSAFRDADPGRKSAYQYDYEVGEILKPLPREFNIAIVLVAHNRKQAAGDVMQRVSGTQGLTGSVDNVIVLERDPERSEGAGMLSVNGRDIEDEVELSLKLVDGAWQYMGKTHEVRTTQERSAVLDAITSIGNKGTAREIHAAMDGDLKFGTTKTRLSRMVKDGALNKSGEFYWLSSNLPEPTTAAPPTLPAL